MNWNKSTATVYPVQKPLFKRPEILLHPNIPKPMHGLAPRTVLGEYWWNKERQSAYRKNNQCCWACGVHRSEAKAHQWLEAHESYDIDYAKGRMVYVESVALCHFCHNYIHSGRLAMLIDQGEITEKLGREIKKHGDSLLRESKLRRETPDIQSIAEWKDWRLVVNGVEYKPAIKSFLEWCRIYKVTHDVEENELDYFQHED